VTRSRLAALAIGLLSLAASPARAQPPSPRVELTGSIFFAGGIDFGTQKATLTGNDPGNPGFTLFSTATTLGAGVGPEARLGIALTRALSVEGAFSWTPQTLETRITGDAENAPDTAATLPLSTMSIGGDAVVRLTSTDDERVQVASGGYFEAGGGARYVISQRAKGFPRLLAIRGDGRLVVRSNAFDPNGAGSSHATWAVTAGMTAGF
jgi:hypothetical protein